MTKIFNGLFYFLKFILYVVAVGTSLFVLFRMYQRLEKPLIGLIYVFIPHILIFALFAINIFFWQKAVTKNVFFNLTCCLVFATIAFVGLRAVLDPYMVYSLKNSFNINFNYFSDGISFFNVMIYGLCIADVFLALSDMHFKKKNKANPQNNNVNNNEHHEDKIAVQIDTL